MHLTFEDVNYAFKQLVRGIELSRGPINPLKAYCIIPTIATTSRVGDVLQVPEPVTITYRNPRNRVLLNSARDCNPFFHLYEALWMLAGRNDIAPLAYYSSGYTAQVQDGNSSFANGAYGYRWRNVSKYESSFGDGYDATHIDQLKIIIDELKKEPTSRRVVLQMWNVEDDLLRISKGPNYSKDVCCNTHAYFLIREDRTCYGATTQGKCDPPAHAHDCPAVRPSGGVRYLDMTVCNRSNDMIWGMLGANYVHFSILQEYLAAHIGVGVGVYNQFTNNLHVYTDRWHPKEWLAAATEHYPKSNQRVPLVRDPKQFDELVGRFVELNKNDTEVAGTAFWAEPFLDVVAQPMMHAFHMHKNRDYESALHWCSMIKDGDWQAAATEWIAKRQTNWRAKKDE